MTLQAKLLRILSYFMSMYIVTNSNLQCNKPGIA